jgi:hypothetical protein
MTLRMSDLCHERASGRMMLLNIDLEIGNEIKAY